MIQDNKDHIDDGTMLQKNMSVMSQDNLTLPVYRETESSTDSYGSDVESITTTSTQVSSSTRPSHPAHPGDNTNPFLSPLDHPSHSPQALPPSQAAEKDAPLPFADEEINQPEGERKKKKKMRLHPLLRGVVILTVSPILMTAVAIFGTGAVIYGTGQLLVGVGDILMGGPLRKKAKKAWRDRRAKRRERKWNVEDIV
ncbi:hypothetical protein EIP86_006415 [Pleurotus ostreatoroseus]|nr:hypothetical protein EIP86_006415 [Pleurotus ostreatoroseus]